MDAQVFRFCRRRRIDRAAATLAGILEGITIDGELNPEEIEEVNRWVEENQALLALSPLDEVSRQLGLFLKSGALALDIRDDIVWVCGNLKLESDASESITQDIQVLHGILHGVLADGVVTEDEAKGLRGWLLDNESLQGSYPYDELCVIVRDVLKDGVVDAQEQELLRSFFQDFIQPSLASRVRSEAHRIRSGMKKEISIPGICAISPRIAFPNSLFTFTGEFRRCIRSEAESQVVRLGGAVSSTVVTNTKYLVIGAAGNPCWMYACYGRKVEKAVRMRKEGHGIVLVHENDFWDAVEDLELEAGAECT